MKTRIFAAVILVALTGCAQNQVSKSQASLPATKNFDACGLSVRFSGKPQLLPSGLGDEFAKEVGTPEGSSWIYSSIVGNVLKSEMALCVCPKEPTLSKMKAEITQVGPFNRFVEGIGHLTESPAIERGNGTKVVTKMAMKSDSSCYLIQVVDAKTEQEVADVALPFFSSLAAIPKEPQKTANFRASSEASVRLKQLYQLLEEKLITAEEFNSRREKILESL